MCLSETRHRQIIQKRGVKFRCRAAAHLPGQLHELIVDTRQLLCLRAGGTQLACKLGRLGKELCCEARHCCAPGAGDQRGTSPCLFQYFKRFVDAARFSCAKESCRDPAEVPDRRLDGRGLERGSFRIEHNLEWDIVHDYPDPPSRYFRKLRSERKRKLHGAFTAVQKDSGVLVPIQPVHRAAAGEPPLDKVHQRSMISPGEAVVLDAQNLC